MNKIDNLTHKADGKHELPSAGFDKFKTHKFKVKKMCNGLTKESKGYKAKTTCNAIDDILQEKGLDNRILYSEVSNYLFNLNDERREVFGNNLEKLLFFAFDDSNNIEARCKKVVVKLYDHFNLVAIQVSAIDRHYKNNLERTIEVSKDEFNKDLKTLEREYIAILGIFASIVLTFVGGMAFSTSVLENISNASIYRILMTAGLLGLVLINVIHMLLKFIFSINGKVEGSNGISVKNINIILIVFMCLIILGWFIDIGILQGRFSYWLHS